MRHEWYIIDRESWKLAHAFIGYNEATKQLNKMDARKYRVISREEYHAVRYAV